VLERIKYSDFLMFWKCAKMLNARERIESIEHSSFPNYKPASQKNLMRDLKRISSFFISKSTSDFSAVVKALAQKMTRNG
jgi:hypothetical protein